MLPIFTSLYHHALTQEDFGNSNVVWHMQSAYCNTVTVRITDSATKNIYIVPCNMTVISFKQTLWFEVILVAYEKNFCGILTFFPSPNLAFRSSFFILHIYARIPFQHLNASYKNLQKLNIIKKDHDIPRIRAL